MSGRSDPTGPAATARRLERWFEAHARDLPWRRRSVRSGYAALVSEAMLQQTQVARVVDAFTAFMSRFPTVQALADADEQDVLAAWSGLGYYRRARHLHSAARTIVTHHGGVVPDDVEPLRALPGVGRYTAGAIASIAFGRRTAIVDGNVARVLLRLHGKPMARDDPDAQRWTWREAESLVNAADSPATLNEALMELGAIICTPRSPRCDACPLRDICVAARDGTASEIPVPRRAVGRTVVHHHAVILRRAGRTLVEQRGDDGLWAAMWQVPTVESRMRLSAAAVRTHLEDRGVVVDNLQPITRFTFLTTHREVRFHVHRASTRRRRGTWLTTDAAVNRPMSAPMRRIFTLT